MQMLDRSSRMRSFSRGGKMAAIPQFRAKDRCEFADSFLSMRMCFKTSPTLFCSLFNPARTTLMISAVKTERVRISSSLPCPTAGPWRPVLERGSFCRNWILEGGESRCLVPRKLNNFKVHLVKTYFSTSFAFSSLLSVGVPRLCVCLRQCERAKVCVILRCVSILLHLCGQKVSC